MAARFGVTLVAALLFAGCAPQAQLTTQQPTPENIYQPVSPTARTGDLLPASIELVPIVPWPMMSLSQTRMAANQMGTIAPVTLGAETYGPRLKQTLLLELKGVFNSAQATDLAPANNGSPLDPNLLQSMRSTDLVAVVGVGVVNLPGIPGVTTSGELVAVLMIGAPRTKFIIKTFRANARVDIPEGNNNAKIIAVQSAIDRISHDFGRQIAADDQVRSLVALGVYQDFGQQAGIAESSPYDPEMNAVVRIEHDGNVGSGFLINSNGLILTAGHVVGRKTSVTVKTRGGVSYTGLVVASDADRDLALVKITDTRQLFPTLKLSPQPTPVIGTDALAIGAPLGLSWSLNKGIVSGVRQLRVARVAQFDTPIDPGDSGGPLIDADSKQVIGVISFVTNNIGFAILAGDARAAFGTRIPN